LDRVEQSFVEESDEFLIVELRGGGASDQIEAGMFLQEGFLHPHNFILLSLLPLAFAWL
jgi:hypothetical protein